MREWNFDSLLIWIWFTTSLQIWTKIYTLLDHELLQYQAFVLSSLRVLQRYVNLPSSWKRDACWFTDLKKIQKVMCLPQIEEQELANTMKKWESQRVLISSSLQVYIDEKKKKTSWVRVHMRDNFLITWSVFLKVGMHLPSFWYTLVSLLCEISPSLVSWVLKEFVGVMAMQNNHHWRSWN